MSYYTAVAYAFLAALTNYLGWMKAFDIVRHGNICIKQYENRKLKLGLKISLKKHRSAMELSMFSSSARI